MSSVRTGKGGADLDLDYVEDWLKPLGTRLRSIRAYNYGEPFLNKQLENFSKRMVARIHDLQIGVSTNGIVFGSEKRFESILSSGIYHIVVSIHGGKTETTRKYMGQKFPFEKVVAGIARSYESKASFRLKNTNCRFEMRSF